MSKIVKIIGAALGAVVWSVAALAGPVSIDHQPIPLARAQLVVAGPDGDVVYTPSELEMLGFKRLTTVTPWRSAPTAFDGVLLTDILAANGLEDATAIQVIAENDYMVRITSDVWERWPILVATRVNGRAHSRRQRGPIQFILPMSDDNEAGQEEYHNNWVWMAARIEAVFN